MHRAESGQEHHGCQLSVGLEGLADVTAVGVGQADVEHDRVQALVAAEQADGLAPVVCDHELVAGELHGLDHDASDGRVVLAQADAGHLEHLVVLEHGLLLRPRCGSQPDPNLTNLYTAGLSGGHQVGLRNLPIMTLSEIVVVSGSYGAGHDAAADALAEQLRSTGQVVRRLDVAEELPWRLGAALRWLYFTQLRVLPGSWGATLRWLERDRFCFRARTSVARPARTISGSRGRARPGGRVHPSLRQPGPRRGESSRVGSKLRWSPTSRTRRCTGSGCMVRWTCTSRSTR